MRRHEIETWAYSIIERVRKRQPIEDDRVELKSIWPVDPQKTARRIAGHANAMHGEPILWLIGVNEKEGTIPGIDFAEFSTWYGAIEAKFDEITPEIKSINIVTDKVTVAALYFETERAPFVVKSGINEREVPWRSGTRIRSAKRHELLKILSPPQTPPAPNQNAALAHPHIPHPQAPQNL